jgi:uncharacterized surface protein with fasciclin (FAS1) repeats
MKRKFIQFLILVLFTSITLSSCKKDEDNDNNTPTQTITEIAQGNSDFSILVQALTRSDLPSNYATILSGEGPYTVFAPTNAAFQGLFTELGVGSLNDFDAATLELVLKCHVVNGKVLAGSLTEGQEITTLQGGNFTIGLSGGAKITDTRGRIIDITNTDLEATNGVIHVINKVILP